MRSVRTAIYLSVTSLSEGLHENVPFRLVVSNVMFQSCNNCLVESLYQFIGLRMIYDRCRVFDFSVSTYGTAEFACKLQAMFG